jgi:hypothetical protein
MLKYESMVSMKFPDFWSDVLEPGSMLPVFKFHFQYIFEMSKKDKKINAYISTLSEQQEYARI